MRPGCGANRDRSPPGSTQGAGREGEVHEGGPFALWSGFTIWTFRWTKGESRVSWLADISNLEWGQCS